MAQRPVQFVCPACGLDASDFVNNLVRQELAAASIPAVAPPPPIAPPPAPTPLPAAPQSQPTARLRVHLPEPAQAAVAPAPSEAPQLCRKHPGQMATEKCFICSGPICPKCMELFGYVCSPLCKAKAESRGIEIPVYEGQKSVVEARLWR